MISVGSVRRSGERFGSKSPFSIALPSCLRPSPTSDPREGRTRDSPREQSDASQQLRSHRRKEPPRRVAIVPDACGGSSRCMRASVSRRGNTGLMKPLPESLDLERIRSELKARRDDTKARVAALAQRPDLGSAQGFGKRIGDGTIEAVSRLTEIGVGESLEMTLERAERALAKLDEGNYGICDACGGAIEPARLRARPDSVLCLACASSEPRRPPPRRR